MTSIHTKGGEAMCDNWIQRGTDPVCVCVCVCDSTVQ